MTRGRRRTGDLVGTLRYMSPEQVRGEPCAGDFRSDIYSLGVTLYEACTLHPAFEACDRSALVHHILNHDPPAPRTIAPTVPKDLETIVLKAMDKLPTGRYATARDMADDLCRFLDDQPIRARRPSLFEHPAAGRDGIGPCSRRRSRGSSSRWGSAASRSGGRSGRSRRI